MLRHHVELSLGNLYVIPENAVIANAQIAYPGGSLFAFLYFRENVLSASGYLAQTVYFLVEAVLDYSTVFHGEGRVVNYRILHQRGHVVEFVYLAVQLIQQRGFHF